MVAGPSLRRNTRHAPLASQEREQPISEVVIGGIRIARLSRGTLAQLMVSQCQARRQGRARAKLVLAANGQVVSLAARNAEFRRQHDLADIVHADGQPIVLAAKWLAGAPIPERSATTDFFHDAASAARDNGLSFFLLGGPETINARCAERMAALYPGLRIAGRHHGYIAREDEERVCNEINASGADVVWVGMGVPLEQDFCARNRDRLDCGWLVTAGGCFHYVTGDYARAPGWMQHLGLEWLHRLAREPARLFRRYAFTNPHALWLILTRTQGRASRRSRARSKAPQFTSG